MASHTCQWIERQRGIISWKPVIHRHFNVWKQETSIQVGHKFLNTESPENYMSKSRQKTRNKKHVRRWMRWPPFSGTSSAKRIVWPGEPGTILVTSQEGIAWNRAEPTDATILDPDGPWSNYTKTKKNLNPKTKTSCHGGFWWVMGMMRSEFHHRFHGFRDFLELSPASSHLSGNGDGQSNCGNINPIW